MTAAFTGALLALLALGSPATASHVSCGAVLNTDTTLDSDLSDCPGSGVVIGASDITVDLGGHTIDGSGTGAGVDNGGGYDRVTVRNGTVREFNVGVFLVSAERNRLIRLRALHNGFFGFYLGGSRENVLSHVSASRNTEAGIRLSGSNQNRVEGSSVSANGAGVLLSGSDHNEVVGNSASGNGDGISGSSSDANRIAGNTATHNSFGIVFSFGGSRLNEIDHNSVSHNGTGIFLGKVGHNRVVRNVASRNRVGIELQIVVDVSVLSNEAVDNEQDGIAVLDGSPGTSLVGNSANRNGDDGIDVDESQTSLTRNSAFHNGDLGIEAVPGVTDGGGNRAGGNGNPAQCTNVSCA